METSLIVAVISASGAIIVPAISFYLTKSKERQADWQRYKFEFYRELVESISGIVEGDITDDAQKRFARASNIMSPIASNNAIKALQGFQDEIRLSDPDREDARHDLLLARLVWEIRRDLEIPKNPPLLGIQNTFMEFGFRRSGEKLW